MKRWAVVFPHGIEICLPPAIVWGQPLKWPLLIFHLFCQELRVLSSYCSALYVNWFNIQHEQFCKQYVLFYGHRRRNRRTGETIAPPSWNKFKRKIEKIRAAKRKERTYVNFGSGERHECFSYPTKNVPTLISMKIFSGYIVCPLKITWPVRLCLWVTFLWDTYARQLACCVVQFGVWSRPQGTMSTPKNFRLTSKSSPRQTICQILYELWICSTRHSHSMRHGLCVL